MRLAIISDRGTLYLPGCLESLNEHWPQHPEPIVVDDSAHRLGMAGAVRAAWEAALDMGARYVFHLEEDFRFLTPPPIRDMRRILDRWPDLAQVVLKRGPWSTEESAAGGIIEMNPTAYAENHGRVSGDSFTQHRLIFSLNPCLIPRRTLELGWPDGNEAEMTQDCARAGMSFAFYGLKGDPPLVEHVGHQRGVGWRL